MADFAKVKARSLTLQIVKPIKKHRVSDCDCHSWLGAGEGAYSACPCDAGQCFSWGTMLFGCGAKGGGGMKILVEYPFDIC